MRPTELSDFDELSNDPPVFRKEAGYTNVVVQMIGGSWGYTLWYRGDCLGGRKDWNWSAMTAAEAARTALSGQLSKAN